MIKNIKIWIGENNDQYSRKVQKYLFSQGVKWARSWGTGDKDVNWCDISLLFIGEEGTLMYGNNDERVFRTLNKYTEMKLVETITYSLEEVNRREKITIGGNTYYIDELEVALKNIKPI